MNGDGSFAYTPATYFNGTDTFQYQLTNGSVKSAPKTVTITVNFVNQAPSFTIPNKALIIDAFAGAQNMPLFAINIYSGAPNEAAQKLNFMLPNAANYTALFTDLPKVSNTGTLTFTPNPNAQGTATFSVVLHDDGGTANSGADTSPTQSFTITINPAPPSLPATASTNGMVGAQFTYTLSAAKRVAANIFRGADACKPGACICRQQHLRHSDCGR